MRLEELKGHLEQLPDGADVDLYTDDQGARFLVARLEDEPNLFLMIQPGDKPTPRKAKTARTKKSAA